MLAKLVCQGPKEGVDHQVHDSLNFSKLIKLSNCKIILITKYKIFSILAFLINSLIILSIIFQLFIFQSWFCAACHFLHTSKLIYSNLIFSTYVQVIHLVGGSSITELHRVWRPNFLKNNIHIIDLWYFTV
jgi:hypothetical protein